MPEEPGAGQTYRSWGRWSLLSQTLQKNEAGAWRWLGSEDREAGLLGLWLCFLERLSLHSWDLAVLSFQLFLPSQSRMWGRDEAVLAGGGRAPGGRLKPHVFLLLPGDMTHELVRHFLIETGPRGVKLKGCPNEPNFGELFPTPVSTARLPRVSQAIVRSPLS